MHLRPRFTLEACCAALGVLCLVLTVLLALVDLRILWVMVPLLAVVALLFWLLSRTITRSVARMVRSAGAQAPGQLGLEGLELPAALVDNHSVIWYNRAFCATILQGQEQVVPSLKAVLPGLDLEQCAQPKGQVLSVGEQTYAVHASQPAGSQPQDVRILYLLDETQLRWEAAEYSATRPACMLLEIDGYNELLADMKDSERARQIEAVNRVMEDYFAHTTGFLRRISDARYIAVVEERHMREMVAAKFDLLDQVRSLDCAVPMTLSIGVGRGGQTLHQCQELAQQSLDMALGRGGDQAAVKTPDGFAFYGGVSRSVEKRSRVKSRIIATALTDMIHQADSVIIMGHRLSDLDSLGSAIGVLSICKSMNVPAVIAIRREATLAQSLLQAFDRAGRGEDFIAPQKALDYITPKTLLIVVDTHIKGLLESREIYEKCRQVVVIDHHRKAVGHIEDAVLSFHEPYASSASELVSELIQYVNKGQSRPDPLEAEALLAGIMLDTRNFALHTGVRTFEAAAYLRKMGAMTERVKLLFNSSMEEYAAKCNLVESAHLYMGCAVSVSEGLPAGMDVAVPQAANDLLTIDGVGASFVAVQKGSDVTISARSMGAVNVQFIMEKLGGGGHLTMAGAQLKNTDIQTAEQKIRQAIAAYRADQEQAARQENGPQEL